MLDVVFIMLIFFIVTASFIKEAGIEVNRPEASTSQPKDNVNILIAVNATNEIWMDKRRIDVRSVRANIERLHAENPKGAVVIQADNKSIPRLWPPFWMPRVKRVFSTCHWPPMISNSL